MKKKKVFMKMIINLKILKIGFLQQPNIKVVVKLKFQNLKLTENKIIMFFKNKKKLIS